MGWRVLLDSWINTLPGHFTADIKQYIYTLIDWTVDYLLEYIRGHINESSPTQDQNLVLSLFKIYKSLMNDLASEEFYQTFSDVKNLYALLEGKFVFSLVWSFGASADTSNRKKI
jgi:dynein heavy chain